MANVNQPAAASATTAAVSADQTRSTNMYLQHGRGTVAGVQEFPTVDSFEDESSRLVDGDSGKSASDIKQTADHSRGPLTEQLIHAPTEVDRQQSDPDVLRKGVSLSLPSNSTIYSSGPSRPLADSDLITDEIDGPVGNIRGSGPPPAQNNCDNDSDVELSVEELLADELMYKALKPILSASKRGYSNRNPHGTDESDSSLSSSGPGWKCGIRSKRWRGEPKKDTSGISPSDSSRTPTPTPQPPAPVPLPDPEPSDGGDDEDGDASDDDLPNPLSPINRVFRRLPGDPFGSEPPPDDDGDADADNDSSEDEMWRYHHPRNHVTLPEFATLTSQYLHRRHNLTDAARRDMRDFQDGMIKRRKTLRLIAETEAKRKGTEILDGYDFEQDFLDEDLVGEILRVALDQKYEMHTVRIRRAKPLIFEATGIKVDMIHRCPKGCKAFVREAETVCGYCGASRYKSVSSTILHPTPSGSTYVNDCVSKAMLFLLFCAVQVQIWIR
ncbi:MAG: hypothetical protein ACE3JU_15335 [Paenibacillus sp.]|uniref:hypothetical protein n=1 Tax=Paenibacillus sp. TaxID=58172 RepID=UPI003B7B54F7